MLVITGKGRASGDGERGVLRRQVPQWLGLPEFRALVIGFEDAHVAHGGEGALVCAPGRRALTAIDAEERVMRERSGRQRQASSSKHTKRAIVA